MDSRVSMGIPLFNKTYWQLLFQGALYANEPKLWAELDEQHRHNGVPFYQSSALVRSVNESLQSSMMTGRTLREQTILPGTRTAAGALKSVHDQLSATRTHLSGIAVLPGVNRRGDRCVAVVGFPEGRSYAPDSPWVSPETAYLVREYVAVPAEF